MATAAEQATAAAAAGYWVDQAAAASAGVTGSTTATIGGWWSLFTGWYAASQVREAAARAAEVSLAAQQATTGLFTEYTAQVAAAMSGSPRVEVPKVVLEPVRNGADPLLVHARPAAVFKRTFALTADDDEALRRAVERAIQLAETDIMLAARQAQQKAMAELGLRGYRRVLRPELSESGPCGLCVVAADRVYRTGELMPIHGRCKCLTVPVGGELDPGWRLNRDDLDRLYKTAGSTSAKDLKRLRVSVNEHGELGPVLTVAGQRFTGPDDLAVDVEQAVRDLERLTSVLNILTARAAAGEELSDQLAYQRSLIARLRTAA